MRAGLLVEKHLTAEGAECAEVFRRSARSRRSSPASSTWSL